MRLRCCLGVAYFLAKSEPVLLIKVLLIKKSVLSHTNILPYKISLCDVSFKAIALDPGKFQEKENTPLREM